MRTASVILMLLDAAGLGACDARTLVGRDSGVAAVAPDDAGTRGDCGQGSDARDAGNPDAVTTGPRLLLRPVEIRNEIGEYPCSGLSFGSRHVRVALVREGLTIVRTVVCTDDSLDLGRVPPGSYLLAAISTDHNTWPIPDGDSGPIYTVGIRAAPYLYPASTCLSHTKPSQECDGVPVEVAADAPTIVPLQLGCEGHNDACGGGLAG